MSSILEENQNNKEQLKALHEHRKGRSYLEAKRAMIEEHDSTLSDMQARRLYLLYKKADWLSTPEEDIELEHLKQQLNTPR